MLLSFTDLMPTDCLSSESQLIEEEVFQLHFKHVAAPTLHYGLSKDMHSEHIICLKTNGLWPDMCRNTMCSLCIVILYYLLKVVISKNFFCCL